MKGLFALAQAVADAAPLDEEEGLAEEGAALEEAVAAEAVLGWVGEVEIDRGRG